MTNRVIFKYPMKTDTITVPHGIVRHVGPQHPMDAYPTAWVEHIVNDEALVGDTGLNTKISFVSTGYIYEEDAEFIGSAVCLGGSLVWHCFQQSVTKL